MVQAGHTSEVKGGLYIVTDNLTLNCTIAHPIKAHFYSCNICPSIQPPSYSQVPVGNNLVPRPSGNEAMVGN